MSLVLYAKNITEDAADIRVVMEDAAGGPVSTFSDVNDLAQWLLSLRYRKDKAVVVLMAREKDELTDLLPILHLFRKVKIILMLPDRKPETIKIGYRLEPRFLSFLDNGLTEVAKVIRAMARACRPGSKTVAPEKNEL